MPLQDAVELMRVVQRSTNLVAAGFARAEALDVAADRIERFFQHAMIAIEKIDRLYQLRIALFEARKIMIVLDVMMRMRVTEQTPPEMAEIVHQQPALHLAEVYVG